MENYDSFGTIGEGTYGIVLKARHKITGQIVAIKKFKESDENEQVRKTALREIRILKQLKHENVVELLEVFRRKGKLYLVFEHVERTILEDLDTHPNGLPPLEVKRCLYQLLKSLEFCHAHKIIHRDIKPENLLISRDGIVKLCDFGFARTTARPGAKYTDYVATRWYRSPELLVGDTEYGKPVDIWAVGCMFAEILNGVPLFPGESDLDQLFQIMKCLGKLTPHQRELFYKNPMYVGVKLPEITKQVTLEAKFPKLEKNALMLMHQCLEYEPANRGTCTDLLRHPYFDGFAQQWEEDRARECNSEDGSRKKSKRDTAPKPAKKAAAAAQRSNHTPISQEAEKMFRALKDSMHGEQQKEGKERSWKSQWDAENTPDERAAPMNNAASDKQKRAVKNASTNHLPDLRPTTPRAARMIAFPTLKAEPEVQDLAMNLNPGPGGAVAPRRKEVVYPVIGAAEQSKAPHSFKMPDWSGAASFPKMDDAKSYGRKSMVPEHLTVGGSGCGGGFKFKSKHTLSKRNLPQFGKTSSTHPPRTPQKYPINTQFDQTYRDLMYRRTPTPSFATRFEPFNAKPIVASTPAEQQFMTRSTATPCEQPATQSSFKGRSQQPPKRKTQLFAKFITRRA